MINPQSRTVEWITEAAQRLGARDIILVKKTHPEAFFYLNEIQGMGVGS